MISVTLDTNIYNRATTYAKRHKTSLVEIIESYLQNLVNTETKEKTETRLRLEKRLNELMALPANWDQEQALPISQKVGNEVSSILNECQDFQLDQLARFPT